MFETLKTNSRSTPLQRISTICSVLKLVFVLTTVHGTLLHQREGMTFVREETVSAGYATWNIITNLDIEPLVKGFQTLETITRKLKESKPDAHQFSVEKELEMQKWKKRYDYLDQLQFITRDKMKEVESYLGDGLEFTSNRQGKGLFTIGGALALSIGTLIYENTRVSERRTKIESFVDTHRQYFEKMNETLDDIYTFSREHITFNSEVMETILQLKKSTEQVEDDLELFKANSDDLLMLDLIMTSVTNGYLELINYHDELISALLDAEVGIPNAFLLSPTALNEVLVKFRDDNEEKLIYGRYNIMEVYRV